MNQWLERMIPQARYLSVYEIPFAEYRARGVEVLVFDIDNTLVSYDVSCPDASLLDLFQKLTDLGFSIAFVSNNSKERVELFNRPLGFFAVYDSHKPLRKALLPVAEHFGKKGGEVLVIGDQLLTDVYAASHWGFRTAVVQPVKEKETLFFRFKRFLERRILRMYEKKREKEKTK